MNFSTRLQILYPGVYKIQTSVSRVSRCSGAGTSVSVRMKVGIYSRVRMVVSITVIRNTHVSHVSGCGLDLAF
jgi:hypothetical protein